MHRRVLATVLVVAITALVVSLVLVFSGGSQTATGHSRIATH